MNVLTEKSFVKDVSKIKDKVLLLEIAELLEGIQKVESISKVANCKKMKGSRSAFRVKFGMYRIGVEYEDNSLILLRFLHRKDIYKYFP